jgi:putative ABC transport system substrate-binding protein
MDRRRFLVTSLAGALASPGAAEPQQSERVRRVGVLMLYPEADPEGQRRATVFREELEERGWMIGRNLQIDYRWGSGDSDWIRSTAAELSTRAPDVILANGGPTIRPVQQVANGAMPSLLARADQVIE